MKIVIVGAGFAGLKVATYLNNKAGLDILLIDQYNHHQFQPLFYQVATAGLDASNISFPLRKLFHKSKNVRIRLAKVESINSNKNVVMTDIGEISYDKLILATGADTNFFGNETIMENTFPMKSTSEALQIRHHLIKNFEEILTTHDIVDLQRKLTIVVVGGGATGVEMAGAIAEMKIHNLPKDYPEIDFSKMKIILLEGGKATLSPMSIQSQQQSQQYLERLGVDVRLNSMVSTYNGKTIELSNGEVIETANVIWAAGIKGNIPDGVDTSLIVRGNRIKVDRMNRLLNHENIFALGDVAYMETPLYPNGHPQLANVAINQGKVLAKNLERMAKNKTPLYEFEYNDKGAMATVGRNLAVVDIPKPKLHFGGFFAWLIWMALHLFLILGVKNKIQIFINWVYKYFTNDQSLRLLFKDFYKSEKQTSKH